MARRAHTPPDTPSRRNGSNDSSPLTKPVFEDVTWRDSHRRNDTLGDIYAQRPARLAEPLPLDQRRMSSAINPQQLPVSASMQHHRQSLSYPPPPAPGSSGPHYQHHASNGSLSHQSYHHLSLNAPPPFPPPSHHGHMYDHGASQYHNAQRAPHPYPSQDSYYSRPAYAGPPPPGYETGYNDIRFQQHVGVDANSFNRKRRGNLPKEATAKLKRWYDENKVSPYPNEEQKIQLCNATNLTLAQVRLTAPLHLPMAFCHTCALAACLSRRPSVTARSFISKPLDGRLDANYLQVSNWFINARRRNPQREAREEKREAEQAKKA